MTTAKQVSRDRNAATFIVAIPAAWLLAMIWLGQKTKVLNP